MYKTKKIYNLIRFREDDKVWCILPYTSFKQPKIILGIDNSNIHQEDKSWKIFYELKKRDDLK